MSTLLLAKDGLRESAEGSEERTLARARTITVLGRFDPKGKRAVMQFLDEADLIQGVEGRGPIIRLSGADLSSANLSGANLSDADLRDADLRDAEGLTKEKMLKQQAKSLYGAAMPDGTVLYATSEFDPALSFTHSDGWQTFAGSETPAAALFSDGPEGGELNFTSPLHVFDPTNPSEPKELPAPENTDEWVSWFQRHPNLDTSKPGPASVGGASGKQIDVTASSTPENYPRDLCGGEPCVPIHPISESRILSYEGFKDRFIILYRSGL